MNWLTLFVLIIGFVLGFFVANKLKPKQRPGSLEDAVQWINDKGYYVHLNQKYKKEL